MAELTLIQSEGFSAASAMIAVTLIIPAVSGRMDGFSEMGLQRTALPEEVAPGVVPLATPSVSVIVPARDEGESLLQLLREIHSAFAPLQWFEIIVVDDGSQDGTLERVSRLRATGQSPRLLRHDRPLGQTAAIVAGARAARGEVLAFIDGDGQNPPEELYRLVRQFLDLSPAEQQGLLVLGERQARRDSLSRRLASRLANRLRSVLLGDGVSDSGSGLKVCRRDELLRLPLFDHAHRYLPALFKAADGRTMAVKVAHRPRTCGRSHYGILDRARNGLLDLPGVFWLMRRSIRGRAREIE